MKLDVTGATVYASMDTALRDKPALNHSLLVRGERISAIACMSVNGLMDVKTVRGTMYRRHFLRLRSHSFNAALNAL